MGKYGKKAELNEKGGRHGLQHDGLKPSNSIMPTVFFSFFCIRFLAKARLPERNMAKAKRAIQSTTYNNNHASRAVDGVVNLANPSCTLNGLHSWWAVDLAQRSLIQKVVVSTDSNAGMGNGFTRSIKVKFLFLKQESYAIAKMSARCTIR